MFMWKLQCSRVLQWSLCRTIWKWLECSDIDQNQMELSGTFWNRPERAGTFWNIQAQVGTFQKILEHFQNCPGHSGTSWDQPEPAGIFKIQLERSRAGGAQLRTALASPHRHSCTWALTIKLQRMVVDKITLS